MEQSRCDEQSDTHEQSDDSEQWDDEEQADFPTAPADVREQQSLTHDQASSLARTPMAPKALRIADPNVPSKRSAATMQAADSSGKKHAELSAKRRKLSAVS